nr:hypothetical protein [Saccharopolyspora sp. ASAGF58]
MRRLFDEGSLPDAARGMIAAFGPGITAEMSVGTWQSRTWTPVPAGGLTGQTPTAGERHRSLVD